MRQSAAANLAASVEALFQDAAADAPGCAVGVMEGGATVFARAFGLASLEHGAPITAATRFYLASVSKQVTALAVLLAADAGHLDLDGAVRKSIPELPAYMDGVTHRRLLTHTAGVRDYFTVGFLAGLGPEHPYSEDDVLQIVGRQRALNFSPGDDFLYSNSGYVLLAIAIARATGKRLDAFARETIFTPLGMDASRFQHDHAAVVPDKAFGYEKRDGQWRTANSMLDVVGDGGMYASLDDMLAWTRNLLAPRVGARAIDAMQTSAVLTSGASTGYGMGLQVGAHRGLRTLEHGGGLAGYRTELLAYPTEGFGVVVLCNDAAAWPALTARRVAEVFLADRMAPAPTTLPAPAAEAVRARAGCYRAPDGDVLALVERDGKLFIQGLPRSLRPLTADTFAIGGDPDLLRLEFEPAGRGFALAQSGGASVRHYGRCEPPTTIDAEAYLGDFNSPDVGAAACEVRPSGDDLGVSFAERPPVTLRPIGSDRLWAADLGATLSFVREPGGAVGGFRLDGGRVRGIAYLRTEQPSSMARTLSATAPPP